MNTFNTVKQIRRIKRQQQQGGPRRVDRLVVKPGTSVFFKKSPRFGFGKIRVVQKADILDISASGLRVQYIAADKWSSRFDYITIAGNDGKTFVDNIHCKIITDSPVATLPDGRYTRVCGVKFKGLSDRQKAELNLFLQEYAVNPNDLKSWSIQFA